MKKIRLWLISFIVLLGLVGISHSTITTNAASDDFGTWGTIDWEFEASTGTLTFTSGGHIPLTTDVEYRPWYNTTSTDFGKAIKKITFEQTCILPDSSRFLFSNLPNLEELVGFDKLDLSYVKDMSSIFINCNSLENINELANWDMSKVENISYMLKNTNIRNLNSLENWHLDNVKYMYEIFWGCDNLEDISALANWNVSNVTDMSAAFNGDSKLKDFTPIATWNVEKVTRMDGLFIETNIENADMLAQWTPKNIRSLNYLFTDCKNLKSVDFSSWNTRNVPVDIFNMGNIFSGCSNLSSVTLGENSIFDSIAKLPAISTASGDYTGEWIGVHTGNIYSSSDDFMTNYDGSIPDTYVWRVSEPSDPVDQSTINVQDSIIYVGDEWSPEDNFVDATDKDGNELEFSSESSLPENSEWNVEWNGEVDTSKPGEYEVEFKVVEYYLGEERIEHATATATITVRERETSQTIPARIEYLDENQEPIYEPKDCSTTIGSKFSFEEPIDIDGYIVDLSSTTYVITTEDESVFEYSYNDVLKQTKTSTWIEALAVLNSKVVANPTKSVVLTYHYLENLPDGGLTISKTVSGDQGDTTKAFDFEVVLVDNANQELTGSYEAVYSTGGHETIQSGDTVKLKDGEHVTISGLPVGTTYTVTETAANSDGYYSYINNNPEGRSGVATGTIAANENAKTAFHNMKTDLELPLSGIFAKAIVGDPQENETFSFTLQELDINGVQEVTTANIETLEPKTNGIVTTATVAGEGDIDFTISGLEEGTYYFKVTENEGTPLPGWTYDNHASYLKCVVDYQNSGADLELTGDVTGFGGSTTFTNTFETNEPETPTYNVGYVFNSSTTGKALPKAVTDLLPSDTTDYEDNAVVTAISPEKTTVSTSTGTWTFHGWDADSKTVSGDDVIFTGTWTFEAKEPDTSDNPKTPDDPDTTNKPNTQNKPDTPSNTDKPSTPDKPNHPATQKKRNTPNSQQKTGKVTTKLPKTGDTQLSGLWGLVFLLSGITLLILKVRKYKIR